MSTLSALLPWFGSKRALSPRIIDELGAHRVYCEPCCGGVSTILAKPRATLEILNDLAGMTVNLVRVLQSARAHSLYDRCSRTLHCEGLYNDARAWMLAHASDAGPDDICPACVAPGPGEVSDVNIEAAYWTLVLGWQGRSGVIGTQGFGGFSRCYTPGGGGSGTRWGSVARSIPAWHERLLGVDVYQQDMLHLIECIPDEDGVVVYVDPPYVVEGERYVYQVDHTALRDALARFKASRVVLSYYDDPLVRELYEGLDGWTWMDLDVAKRDGSHARDQQQARRSAPEVLLMNGPSYTQGASLFAEVQA